MTRNMVRFEEVQEIACHEVEGCIGLQVMVMESHYFSPFWFGLAD